MKQCVLQNILKVNPIYSAGCPKREAACSSEYTEEEGDTFFLSAVKMHVICSADNPPEGDTVSLRVQ